MLNHKDSHNGRVFTLIHEFVHLLLNESGVCDCNPFGNKVEIFCNRVAGAVLVPGAILNEHMVVKQHRLFKGGPAWDETEIEKLSRDFSVSNEAVVRRLLILGHTTKEFYLEKREEYLERWERILLEKKKERKEGNKGGPLPPYMTPSTFR